MSDSKPRGSSSRGSGSNTNRGSTRGGGAGGSRGGRGHAGGNEESKPKREAILDLAKYLEKRIRVKFTGGREVTGILKGYDQLLNLVMDDIEELLRDPDTNEPFEPSQTRSLGLAVLRGTSLILLSPVDGSSSIANPFVSAE